MEDTKIVELFFKRDENAVNQTSEKYGSRLRTIAYSITRDKTVSEECENDTYLEAWNRIPPSDPSDYLYSFLARIIRCLSIDRCRNNTRLKRSATVVELTEELEKYIPSVNDVADDVERIQLGEEISKFIYTLSDEKQVMFVRRYYYLDSISEIARRLSIGESKVKTSLFRIRNDLKEYLVGEGYTI